jgi:plastocyanin
MSNGITRAHALAALVALAAGALALPIEARAQAAAAASPAPAAMEVHIDNFTFSPPTLTVPPGTTVTWVNADDIPHAVAAKDRSFRSKVLDTDDRFSFTFTGAGEFEYFCTLHPHMVGKVVVKSSS